MHDPISDEICSADPPRRFSAAAPLKLARPSVTKLRRPAQFQIHWFNELESDVIHYGIIRLKSTLARQKSWGTIAFGTIACIALLFSSMVSISQTVHASSRSSSAAHAALATVKLMVFLAFCFRLLYTSIRKQTTLVGFLFVLTSLCVQFATLVPSIYFTGLTQRCLFDNPFSNMALDNGLSPSLTPWSLRFFVIEFSILLTSILATNLYLFFLVHQLITSHKTLRQYCRGFLLYCPATLIVLQLGSAAAVFVWLLNVSCSNHLPIPAYLTDVVYLKRFGFYGWRDTPRILIVLGCMLGFMVPAGIAAFVATHLEYFMSICAGVLAADDQAPSPKTRAVDAILPDHVVHAARTYLSWFCGRPLLWRYGSLWTTVKTMRRREKVQHVVARLSMIWIWYTCAVIAPVVVAAQCSPTWHEWTETGGYSAAYFIAPLAIATCFAILANPLSVIVAPVSMVLFTCWFLALVAVQVFYFGTLILYPNSNF